MKGTLFILIIAFFTSCNTGNKTPDYVIPHDDMVKIIIDMHITDGLLTVSNVRRNLAKDSINYYDVIFKNYGYHRSDFDTSIYFYSKNINEYDRIYADVLNKLNEMETELKGENSEETSKKKNQE
ncbi:DUF4296 domain-containing protein [Bacteroidota bacterium]